MPFCKYGWDQLGLKKEALDIILDDLVTEMEFSVPAKMNPIQCSATGVGIPAAACNPHLVTVRSLKEVL